MICGKGREKNVKMVSQVRLVREWNPLFFCSQPFCGGNPDDAAAVANKSEG